MFAFVPKKFTEEETNVAKKRGLKGQIGYAEYQQKNGELSGAARRHKALALALAGTKSRKTARTACTSIMNTIELIEDEQSGFDSFKKTIFNLAKKMPPLEVFFIIHKRVQYLFVQRYGGRWVNFNGLVDHVCLMTGVVTWHNGPNRTSNPFKDFENACALAEEFIKEILTNFSIASNPSNTPIANTLGENKGGLDTESTKSGSFTSNTNLPKRTSLRLPAELYAHIRTIVTKLLPKNDCRQVIGKLADCFKRHDIDRFEYILSEASKSRNIFANVGKGTGKRSRNVLIDTGTGAMKFLEKYGVASDKQTGFIYA